MKSALNRTLILTTALSLALGAGASWAGPRSRDNTQFYDYARVVSSTPIYEEINEPRSECWTEQVSVTHESVDNRSYGSAIIGGLVGGILGNQVSKGSGRKVATVLGATTGAIVGNNVGNNGARHVTREYPEEVERCRSIDNWTRRITGYDVAYRYQGREYNTYLPFDPGRELKLKVNVSVAER